jgi:predicted lipid-binding transport protein (Tim44 family)
MGETSDLFQIAVLAALAGFVAWRLISVLGSRTGHEPPPADRRNAETNTDSVTDIFTRKPRAGTSSTTGKNTQTSNLPSSLSETVRTQLAQVQAIDDDFSYDQFISGAREAYPMILEAFWNNDTITLKPLLSDEVFTGFEAAIAARAEAKDTAPKLQRLHDAEITQATIVAATIQLTIRFTATISSNDGPITAEDIWTFSRHARSNDPNWLLTATDDSIGA